MDNAKKLQEKDCEIAKLRQKLAEMTQQADERERQAREQLEEQLQAEKDHALV